ncbi:alpha/beta hydrolase-fold protein [soil metagenome]
MAKSRGTILEISIQSKILKNNPLKDPYIRNLYVYLPPSYYSDPAKKYPVVYLIAGFTGKGTNFFNYSYLGERINERLDRLYNEKTITEMIVVMPDCITKYGGSQFINSTATGNYEDYIIKEIVPFVDTNFRTVAKANARGICGKSSGGYGAMVLSMKNPDVFGLMCSTAGDAYFDYCYFPDLPNFAQLIRQYGKGYAGVKNFINKEVNTKQPKPKGFHSLINTIGMASAYSPNPGNQKKYGFAFDIPIDPETGELNLAVWNKWLKWDPVRMAEKYKSNLKKLSLIYIDAGTKDEFNLHVGARIFCSRLKSIGVKYKHEEFNDGHMNIQYRQDRSFKMLSDTFKKNIKK